jgi:ATP-dependent Lhr-like helicase
MFAAWFDGRDDLLLLAPTGSGKTFAASLPILAALDADRAEQLAGKTSVLVLCPTRALVEQHRDTLSTIARGLVALDRNEDGHRGDSSTREPLAVASRTGDTPSSERAAQKRKPPAVLVVTPESLAVLLGSNARESLDSLSTVLLDEVHQLSANKRGALLSVTLASLDALCRARGNERPRRVALTATAHPITEITAWIAGGAPSRRARTRPVTVIEAGAFRPPAIELLSVRSEEPFPSVGYSAKRLLPAVARAIAQCEGTTMIFVSSRPRAEAWTRALRDILPANMPVACFHGSMSADERGLVALRLQRAELRAVVATSSLEAGIDVPAAEQVLFLGAPATVTQAVQSAGRSRHRPDATPRALVACTDVADLVDAVAVRRCSERAEIEPTTVREGDEDVLVQGVLALLAMGSSSHDELARTLRDSRAFSALDDETIAIAVDHLRTGGDALAAYDEAHKIIADDSGLLALAGPHVHRAYLRGVGTIVDEPAVAVHFGARLIGRIEGRFAAALELGDRFALGGSTWTVLARPTPARMDVARAERDRGPVAQWTGSRAPRSDLVAREVARCYRALDECASSAEADGDEGSAACDAIAAKLSVDLATARLLLRWTSAQRAVSLVPSESRVLFECVRGRTRDTLIVYTFAGWAANEVLARVAAERWRVATGAGCELSASDLGLALVLPRNRAFSVQSRESALSLFAPSESAQLRSMLARTLEGSMLARASFREVARVSQLSTADTRPGAATPGLLYDVLRKHSPGHLLLRALDRTIWASLDGPRAERWLERCATSAVDFVRLDQPSPMSIPVLARGERTTDRVAPDDLDGALARAAHQLWLRAGGGELP